MPRQLESKPCRICGKPVERWRRKDRKAFHYPLQCKDCYDQTRDESARRVNISRAMKGLNNPRSKPMHSTRLRTDTKGFVYRMIKVKESGRWMYEHRFVMEQILGRKLNSKEHVHHKDENTLNNEPDNLQVLHCTDHNKHHFSISTWSKNFPACIVCGDNSRRHSGSGKCSRCYQRDYSPLSLR